MIPEPVRTLLIMFLLRIEMENDPLHFKMDRDYFIYIYMVQFLVFGSKSLQTIILFNILRVKLRYNYLCQVH
jgi:hypothetical protein